MFRNEYDDSVATWSPQGRIHQIEYAEEAIKHGSATLGLKSQTHVALVALERVLSDLSIHQKKILTIDSHVGISMAGLTADARVLSKFMQTECSNSRSIYETPLRVSHLVAMVGSKTHMDTQCAAGRPLGVGLLVAGYDEDGSHLYQACPSVNFLDCKAMAIGARSQPARTYLERHLDEFPKCNSEELIKHGLRALRDTLQKNVILTSKNCSVALVGEDTPFTIYEDEHIDQYLKLIEDEERSGGAGKDDKPTQMDGDPGSGAGPDAQASTSDTSDQ